MSDSVSSLRIAAAAAFLLVASVAARAEDGYRLWLRYDPIESPLRQHYAAHATELVVHAHGPTASAAEAELERGLSGLLASPVPLRSEVDRDGAILLMISRTDGLGAEGFTIRSARMRGHVVTV